MHPSAVSELAKKFRESYDQVAKDQIWQQQSQAFRKFWAERILNPATLPLTDDECDAVIRMMDRNGKGNTKSTEAIARAMVPQGAWRRMFAKFRSEPSFAALMDSILVEKDEVKKAAFIDELYRVNAGEKNNLTGESGNTVNCFLAIYDPFHNLSVISLKDRRALCEFFDLGVPFSWETSSVGTRIIQSNRILLEGLGAAGVGGGARTASVFCYWSEFKELWKEVHTAKREDKTVAVTIPADPDREEAEEVEQSPSEEIRESLQIQALLAEIGARMGMKIWLPKSDRVRVLKKWKAEDGELLNELPLHYDNLTMKTIQQIDVLWMRKRSIVRAFEVEHTTSVYSGLLRMADLVALQPNLAIDLHIVAPSSRREKVFEEIQRPVFSLLEGRALAEICTYLSYESVRELALAKHLEHLSDSVIREYAEEAETL